MTGGGARSVTRASSDQNIGKFKTITCGRDTPINRITVTLSPWQSRITPTKPGSKVLTTWVWHCSTCRLMNLSKRRCVCLMSFHEAHMLNHMSKSRDEAQFDKIIHNTIGTTYNFTCRAKSDTYNVRFSLWKTCLRLTRYHPVGDHTGSLRGTENFATGLYRRIEVSDRVVEFFMGAMRVGYLRSFSVSFPSSVYLECIYFTAH